MQANNAIPTEMGMDVSVMVNVNDCRCWCLFFVAFVQYFLSVEHNRPTEFNAHDHLLIKIVVKIKIN